MAPSPSSLCFCVRTQTITPVGGTTCYEPEIAASLSGGVLLNYFQRASFHPQAAHPLIQSPGKRATGCDIPDVAAQARAIRSTSDSKSSPWGRATSSTSGSSRTISLLDG
ncbi:hypothetical protein H4582DRAFT_2080696 [Lactarius indigo]|nr:hypothetical protein H4582DRAFT_2080696 [Lactarius indigo]